MIRSRKALRVISIFLLVQFASQTFLPSVTFALTSGPSQPEFSSFEPVATTNMVDEFSGDFTYNLPVLEVPGPQGSSYPLSLSYHSGVTPEEEASWVGYGWTLNPGAINRDKRGVPDDFNGDNASNTIKYYNRMPKNWTASVNGSVGFEIASYDLSVSKNSSVRYNNYRGFGYSRGIGVSLAKGIVSLGYGVSDGRGSFSLDVDPSAMTKYMTQATTFLRYDVKRKKKVKLNNNKIIEYTENKKLKTKNSASVAGSTYGIFSYAESTMPNIVQKYDGNSFNLSFGFQLNPFVFPAGLTLNLGGSYSYQKNADEDPIPAYGYLYSSGATASGANKIMDYHVEKETDFNKRDVFLGIPFNDADNFIVTGEGLAGGFRLYNKTAGHFGPRNIKSVTNIYNLGVEIDAALTSGVGLDLGAGWNSLEVQDWSKGLSFFTAKNSAEDEPVFFRFNNDLGGDWGKNHPTDNAFQASISSAGSLTEGSKHPVLSASQMDINKGERSGRSSYIGYNTNAEMVSSGTTPSYKSYNKNQVVNGLADRASKPDLIGELAVFNETGNRYVYALPAYSSNEKDISYSVERSLIDGNIENNYSIYYKSGSNLDAKAKIKVGQFQEAPYASSYLLTEITTPDYVDRGDGSATPKPNGPTPDDLGGYTRFNYVKHLDNYHWRAPYNGLIYSKNSHSDPKDDMGTYTEGVKQIYYVRSVETKTHVAIFRTVDRPDSKEAPWETDPLLKGSSSTRQLQKLVAIELYYRQNLEQNAAGELILNSEGYPTLRPGVTSIKTVRFEYDNTRCPGLPNAGGLGKLTLLKVWFEYNDVDVDHGAKISPYKFKYEYPKASASGNETETVYDDYPAKYKENTVNGVESIEDVTKFYKSLGDQNPPYSPLNIDAWGNYQTNGVNRYGDEMHWIDQSKIPNKDFDPAPWHLKVIQLPSGGEIHIQYEQDDYNYVQDQEAHVMATLINTSTSNHFIIDAQSIGLVNNPLSPEDKEPIEQIKKMINERYVKNGKKIYFKFLYTLLGGYKSDLNSCNADFITGYAPIKICAIDANNNLYIELQESARLPDQVCEDFVESQRLGLIYESNCGGSSGLDFDDSPDTGELAESALRAVVSSAIDFKLPSEMCKAYNPIHSYLRIPTSIPKKGGGTRVKRLMMFDKGIEGEAVLYGNEYIYKTKSDDRVISSGVATNEPTVIHEENILTDYIKRDKQTALSAIVAGEDKKQSEGALGESILPGPSVGYSKVIVRNIHSGKTNPGFSITEFYTAKDYPVKLASPVNEGSMTPIERATPETVFLPTGIVNIITDKSWVTQGFSFVLNSMHGQMKSTASYSGSYGDEIDLSESAMISRSDYTYYEPGEKIPMMSSLEGGITMKNPGREVDLTFAQRQVVETVRDINVEVDVELSTLFPYIMFYPTAMPSISFIDGSLHTHSTTKVVRYPAILKKVSSTQEGITHHEEYIAFDEYTGSPVAVRSDDEFKSTNGLANANISKGAYLTQKIPASWQYKNMAPKWTAEGLRFATGSFTLSGEYVGLSDCNLALFSTGDKIEIGTAGALYHVVEIDNVNNRLKVTPSSDALTTATTAGPLTIFRTGKTNQLQQQAGTITQYSELRDNAVPTSISTVARYDETTNFASDLKNAIKDNTTADNGELPYLSGPYLNMDISGFADRLTTCNKTLTDVTIKDVKFMYAKDGTQVTLQLLAFKVKCGDTGTESDYVQVKADGWE
jgi:hypothetical protein